MNQRTPTTTTTTLMVVVALALMGVLLALSSDPAHAANFTVDRPDDTNLPDGVGACTANPDDCSLRGALVKSWTTVGADTINFALPGFALPGAPQGITLKDALTTGNDAADILTINGPGQNLLTVKQTAQVRVFQIVGKTTIKGITISGGRSINNAGGILNNGGANLTLNDTTVTDNQALGTTAFTGDGGGIYNAANATLTLNRSTVSANKALNTIGDGGGIYNQAEGNVTLNNSTVNQNESDENGGGIYNNGGTLSLNNSTVSDNKAESGGGIFSRTNLTGPLKTTVTNSTISANTATGDGGGIYNLEGRTAIEHSTITNNAAPSGQGSGVSSGGANASAEVLSTIISANQGTDVDVGTTNSFLSKGYNLIGTGNATANFNKTGDQTGIPNPGVGPLTNNGGPTQTHAVLKGSRAIDRGALRGCPATDQRGKRRPQNGDGKGTSRCDVGAFEKKAVR